MVRDISRGGRAVLIRINPKHTTSCQLRSGAEEVDGEEASAFLAAENVLIRDTALRGLIRLARAARGGCRAGGDDGSG